VLQQHRPNPLGFNLGEDNFFYAVAITNETDFFNDPSIYKPLVSIYRQHPDLSYEYLIFDFEPCNMDNYIDNPLLHEKLKQVGFLEKYYCLPKNMSQAKLFGSSSSSQFTWVEFQIVQCFNTTTKNDCASQRTIDEQLLYVYSLYSNWNEDTSNFAKPLSLEIVSYYTELNSKQSKTLKPTIYEFDIQTD
jgi:hypothetical protein